MMTVTSPTGVTYTVHDASVYLAAGWTAQEAPAPAPAEPVPGDVPEPVTEAPAEVKPPRKSSR